MAEAVCSGEALAGTSVLVVIYVSIAEVIGLCSTASSGLTYRWAPGRQTATHTNVSGHKTHVGHEYLSVGSTESVVRVSLSIVTRSLRSSIGSTIPRSQMP